MFTQQPNRFDYVEYDEAAAIAQATFKSLCMQLEAQLDAQLQPGRAKSLAVTKAEELYMWIGKAIRDDQIARNGSAPLQESRGNA